MEIFKNGKKSYVVMPKSLTRDQALKEANRHIKTKKADLEIQSGRMLDAETVVIGKKGYLWVISRRKIA